MTISVGDKFGKLTTIEEVSIENARTKWHCRCKCGRNLLVDSKYLLDGDIKHCGCFKMATRTPTVWTDENLKLLGTMPNKELAAKIGTTLGAVWKKMSRIRLGRN